MNNDSNWTDLNTRRLPRTVLWTGRLLIVMIALGFFGMLLGFATKQTVAGTIRITTDQPVIEVHAERAGRFVPLLTEDQAVAEGEPIGYVTGDFDYAQIDWLRQELARPQGEDLTAFAKRLNDQLPVIPQVGPLYPGLEKLRTALTEYTAFERIKSQEIAALQAGFRRQYQTVRDEINLLENGDELYEKRQSALQSDLQRSRTLTREELMSERDRELAEIREIEAGIATLENRVRAKSLERGLAAYENDLTRLRSESDEKLLRLRQSVVNALSELRNALYQWEQQHLLLAPIGGRCKFNDFVLDRGQELYVEQHEVVAKVYAAEKARYLGQLELPPAYIGKVSAGDRVRISLDNYPFLEYGALFGEIEYLSEVPFDNTFRAVVRLPAELRTSYGIPITYIPQMSGRAEVVISDTNLFEKIVNSLRWIRYS